MSRHYSCFRQKHTRNNNRCWFTKLTPFHLHFSTLSVASSIPYICHTIIHSSLSRRKSEVQFRSFGTVEWQHFPANLSTWAVYLQWWWCRRIHLYFDAWTCWSEITRSGRGGGNLFCLDIQGGKKGDRCAAYRNEVVFASTISTCISNPNCFHLFIVMVCNVTWDSCIQLNFMPLILI